MELNSNEKKILKNLRFYKYFSICLIVFGIFGIALWVYCTFFKEITHDAKPLLFSLGAYSIGFLFAGYLFNQAFRLITRLKMYIEKLEENKKTEG